jgi:dTDP-4-dehydrorhamnose 3,5-epimerase-like enzyme
MVWNKDGFDILYDFESIQFTDTSIDLTGDKVGQLIATNQKGVEEYISGTKGTDIFVIDAFSTEFNWTRANDGEGVLVWNDEGFDILWDFEALRFKDRDIDLTADKLGQIVAKDVKGEEQYLDGTEGTDTFVIDGDSDDYQIAKADDGVGVIVWNDQGFDMLWDFEEIQFNDQTLTIQDELA